MPTYDYVCDACKNAWEEFQPMSAGASRKCPKCGKLKARRLIGAGAGLIFKGSGFYVTDYKKSGASGSKSSGGERGGESSSQPDSKPADSKPADAKGGDSKANAAASSAPAESSKKEPAKKSADKPGKSKA